MADVYRRCGCRGENGKTVGAGCPHLKDPKHGTWGFYVAGGVHPGTGKRIQVRKMGFATKRDAQQERSKVVTEVATGRYKGDQKLTVGEFLPAWLERRIRDGLRPTTTKMYRSYIEKDIVPALGTIKLSELRRSHVDRFVQQLQADGRGATTTRRIHATLSSALTAAERLDLVDYNAASKIALPAVAKQKIRMWEPDEANTFLAAAGEIRLGTLFEVEVRSGLRRGELCGLRWSDVDITKAEIIPRVQLTQIAGSVLEGPIKTDAGQDRVIALDADAVGSLIGWKLMQDQERDAWGDAYVESGRVFTYEDGRALRPAHVSRVFDTLVTKAKLRDIRFHDLRHLHASLLIAAGVPIAVVSKRMGHSTIAVTVDLYGHLLRDANRQAADAVSTLLTTAAAHTLHTQAE